MVLLVAVVVILSRKRNGDGVQQKIVVNKCPLNLVSFSIFDLQNEMANVSWLHWGAGGLCESTLTNSKAAMVQVCLRSLYSKKGNNQFKAIKSPPKLSISEC